jgi:hypothetical protein
MHSLRRTILRADLPLVSLNALGLVTVGIAMAEARYGKMSLGEALFWSGLLLLVVPTAWRILSAHTPAARRIELLAVLGLELYLAKLLHSPLQFTFYDELLHERTLANLLQSGHLFRENSLLPVSPYYPGLENVAAAVVQICGVSPFVAGALVVAAARLTLVLSLYLLLDRAVHSSRIAALATLLYIANPAFLFFDAQFAYESLALPLALLALLVEVCRQQSPPDRRRGYSALGLLALAAVTVTHHLTALILAAFLALWSGVAYWMNRRDRALPRGRRAARRHQIAPASPYLLAGAAVAGIAAWLAFTGPVTLPYLGGDMLVSVRETVSVLTGQAPARRLFQNFNDYVTPPWERYAALCATGLTLLTLPAGLWGIRQRFPRRVLPLTLGVASLAYPASHTLRIIPDGVELVSRTPEFVYLALGFALAAAAFPYLPARSEKRWHNAILVCGLALLFVGNVTLGVAHWWRLPGPYMVAADTRSIEPIGLSAARWAKENLGTDQNVAADRINDLLMLAQGQQRPVTQSLVRLSIPGVFFAPTLGEEEWAVLQQARVQFIVVDHRLSTGVPTIGWYYEPGEPGARDYHLPMKPGSLAKFDGDTRFNRIYDSGALLVYRVGA